MYLLLLLLLLFVCLLLYLFQTSLHPLPTRFRETSRGSFVPLSVGGGSRADRGLPGICRRRGLVLACRSGRVAHNTSNCVIEYHITQANIIVCYFILWFFRALCNRGPRRAERSADSSEDGGSASFVQPKYVRISLSLYIYIYIEREI